MRMTGLCIMRAPVIRIFCSSTYSRYILSFFFERCEEMAMLCEMRLLVSVYFIQSHSVVINPFFPPISVAAYDIACGCTWAV